jgi:putative drug exporter of the RND superfamily
MRGPAADRTVVCMTNQLATGRTTTSTLGRLGAWAVDHRRRVLIGWAAVVLCLGALAPFADSALSGAGWEAPNSESGSARRAVESHFPG